MARTTSINVESILVDHYDGTTSLIPFMDIASSLVDKIVTADTDGVLSTSDLELIERNLTAHFYGHADQFFTSKSTGQASGSFQGQTAMYFNSTLYGQTAVLLDCTGELSRLQQQAQTGRKKASMTWLGTRYENDESELATDQ
jgi:hypothetical protein